MEDIEEVEQICAENNEMIFRDTKHPKHIEYSIATRPDYYDEIDNVYKQNQDPKLVDALIERYGKESVDNYLKLNQK